MATNVFFSPKVRTEQHLYEDIVIEALQMYGQDVYYIPRSQITQDVILNDDYSEFKDSYAIEMYIANTEGFEGEGNLMSKFGLEIRDQATFVVAKRRFGQLVDIPDNSLRDDRPREGDLIYLPLSKSLFEIKFVEHEKPFYQVNQLPTYELQCELFEYSSEKFDVGIEEIDRFEQLYATRETLLIDGGVYGFAPGDRIEQQLVPFKESSASAQTTLVSSSVDTVAITEGGFGYTSVPSVVFEAPPSGVTAQGTAVLTDGVVTSITITNPGNGYLIEPGVTISPSPAADIPAVKITGEIATFDETRAAAGIITRQARIQVVDVQSSLGDTKTFLPTDLSNNIGKITHLTDPNNNWSIVTVYKVGSDGFDIPQEPLSQNEDFETEADSIIDFSESNPFGDPSTE